MLHQSAHIVQLIIAVSGIDFIDLITAVELQFCAIFGMNVVNVTMALTAIDRLIAVLAPFWFNLSLMQKCKRKFQRHFKFK